MHFNCLTAAQDERLAMLIEEVCEVGKAAAKIQRHGYDNFYPDIANSNNKQDLEKELIDVYAVMIMMVAAGDITIDRTKLMKAVANKMKYAHHQED